jgi:RNA polymerase sigma factor (sigma-70 family)
MSGNAEVGSPDESPLLDDAKLIDACLKGDSQAWEALIHRYQRLIYSVPIKIGFSPIDAADIFQSVCVKLLEGLSSLREREKVSSWLITTTTRECWRVIAKQRRETAPSIYGEDFEREITNRLKSAEPLADQKAVEYERQQLVREAVSALPERCRMLITMLFYGSDEASYAEIARKLNIPMNSLGPTRARCLQKLKKTLQGRV